MQVRKPMAVLISLLAFTVPSAALASTALVGGKVALFRNKFGTEGDSAKIRFSRDEALIDAGNPLCPAETRIQIGTNARVDEEVVLPCSLWTRRGATFRYRDPLASHGGVRSIAYKPSAGRLSVSIKGGDYPVVTGPVTFVDFRFAIGSNERCGRFTHPRKNDSERVLVVGPTTSCGLCGDGVANLGEQCDDGNAIDGDGCDSNCTFTACGNSILTAGESCDDGNATGGDGCRSDCTLETCGDGVVDVGESCDDGNALDGDCCSSSCLYEAAGSSCTSDDNPCTDDVCSGAGTCGHVANTAPCSDESFCTVDDTCVDGVCVGTPVEPWINEFDYDGGEGGATPDGDEFVEIAAPAGVDLGGYQLVSVEGNLVCGTGTAGTQNGEANLLVSIPAGTVLDDPDGTGIGFLVVCFENTSVRQPNCDLVLPGPDLLDNLRDGDLLNLTPATCPDGLALVSPSGGVVDALSYEGLVPNAGAYGGAFQSPAYSVGRDLGAVAGVSFEKTTSAFGRAMSASEWQLSGGCVDAGSSDAGCLPDSHSAGAANPGQDFQCAEVLCGDGIVTGNEDCDEGPLNSDGPDATCRLDCTAQRCGDDVVDPGFGEQCEVDSDCGTGEFCRGCGCFVDFDLTIVPGPSEGTPADDGESTWLRITPLFGVENGTDGQFDPGPLVVARLEPPGADGRADLILKEPAITGANDPLGGTICFRFEQDPEALGEVDCDGGTNYDVTLVGDSNGQGANGAPQLTVGAGASDSGAGAGVLRLLLFGARDDGDIDCADIDFVTPPIRTAYTTATATAQIQNTRQGGDSTVVLSGQPFDCAAWSGDGGVSLAGPNINYDFVLPFGLGTQDVSQVLRLNDD